MDTCRKQRAVRTHPKSTKIRPLSAKLTTRFLGGATSLLSLSLSSLMANHHENKLAASGTTVGETYWLHHHLGERPYDSGITACVPQERRQTLCEARLFADDGSRIAGDEPQSYCRSRANIRGRPGFNCSPGGG